MCLLLCPFGHVGGIETQHIMICTKMKEIEGVVCEINY